MKFFKRILGLDDIETSDSFENYKGVFPLDVAPAGSPACKDIVDRLAKHGIKQTETENDFDVEPVFYEFTYDDLTSALDDDYRKTEAYKHVLQQFTVGFATYIKEKHKTDAIRLYAVAIKKIIRTEIPGYVPDVHDKKHKIKRVVIRCRYIPQAGSIEKIEKNNSESSILDLLTRK